MALAAAVFLLALFLRMKRKAPAPTAAIPATPPIEAPTATVVLADIALVEAAALADLI